MRASATGTLTQVYLRNPRFLQTYTPPGGTGALQNFLLADDNGVFDLFLNSGGQFEAQWGLTQADYRVRHLAAFRLLPQLPLSTSRDRAISVPAEQPPAHRHREVNGYLMGHYIVANGYSTGEVTPTSGFGGEALELNDIINPASPGQLVTQDFASFSKPGNTAPLSQPAFAVREK